MKKLLLLSTCLISGMAFAQQAATTTPAQESVMAMVANAVLDKLRAHQATPATETKPVAVVVEKEVAVAPDAVKAPEAQGLDIGRIVSGLFS